LIEKLKMEKPTGTEQLGHNNPEGQITATHGGRSIWIVMSKMFRPPWVAVICPYGLL